MWPIRIGYACINTSLRDYDIFTSRTLKLSTIESQGMDKIKKILMENIDDLMKIIIYNEAHGIRFFRISSNIFPHLGNPKMVNNDYNLDFVKDKMKVIGKYAKDHGHRLTMHPGQFVQLGSLHEEVVKQSIIELENHSKVLKMLGYKPIDGAVLIIHGGGTYGDKQNALIRWKNNFRKLSAETQEYISIENDENSYSVMDLLPLSEELNIPLCLDIFHNKISKNRVAITKKLMRRIINTWKKRQMIPKIHISEQQEGLHRGAHSKTLDKIPLYVFRLPEMFQTPLDIMFEVKDKEVSVFKIYYRYFDLHVDADGRINYVLKK